MSEHIVTDAGTDAQRADGGPATTTPARPADEVKLVELRKLRLERVVLVGVAVDGSVEQAERSVEELHRLAETAGAEVLDTMVQRRARPDAGTFIGKGKAKELAATVRSLGADTVIMDDELSPGQLRHLEELVDAKMIDRTVLILDIFAQHATSREGKTQVELAQLNYMLPRLRGWGEALSRQAGGRAGGATGGVGLRGPGETKLETDRRRIHRRIAKLRREIAGMRTVRDTKRGRRLARRVPAVAIVGYTNAGKSSLLNALTGAGVLVQDALFATLDPTTRRAVAPDGRGYTLTDTVGFVRHLPHQLVEAFRSTLEETVEADLLLHVVDGADAMPDEQVKAVRTVLSEVLDGAGTVAGAPPELLVVNKVDAVDEVSLARLRHLLPRAVFVSARTGAGLDELVARIGELLPRPDVEVDVEVPYAHGGLVARVYAEGQVISAEHTEAGTRLRARVHPDLAGALAAL